MDLLKQYAPQFTNLTTKTIDFRPTKKSKMAEGSHESILDVAATAGLTSLNPSDLVFEANQRGIAYYDFVLSSTRTVEGGLQLFLAKLDSRTNVEWFETVNVDETILTKNNIPINDLALMTLGILTWRTRISQSRILCLVNDLGTDSSLELEALKRAANKFKCMHHVLTIGSRRRNSLPALLSSSGKRSSISSQDGMRLRIMMCQTRAELDNIPTQAIRETRYLLVPNSNPLLCLCFPLTS
uniref:MutS-like protein n=1 Tax=Panagrolaimus sp. JU765 TaxID=591449 RepID=A0AC34Q662_9BILA